MTSSGGTTTKQPVLADGQTVADGAHSVGHDRHHAANSDVGGILLHRLGGANPLREGRPGGVFKEGEPPETRPRELRLQQGGVLQEDVPQPPQQREEFLTRQIGIGDAAGLVVGHGGVYPGPQLRREGRRRGFLAPP